MRDCAPAGRIMHALCAARKTLPPQNPQAVNFCVDKSGGVGYNISMDTMEQTKRSLLTKKMNSLRVFDFFRAVPNPY